MITHMKNMQKILFKLQQIARRGYLTSLDQWDACSAVQAIALVMEHDIDEQIKEGRIHHARLKDFICALETVGIGTPDKIRALIRDLGSARNKMIYHTKL